MWSPDRSFVSRHAGRLFLPLAVLWLAVGCERAKDINGPVDTTPGSWAIYSPFDWPHDGRPYRSVYCDVFSDGATDAMKEKVGRFADSKFLEVLDFFDFTQVDDFLYPPGDEKFNVYIIRHHEVNIAAAYWGTIFITIRTSDIDTSRYHYLFRHELTHIFEFMIEGLVNLTSEDWFTEGMAVCAGGGLDRINSVADLEDWQAQHADYPNGGNPISIKDHTDWPAGVDMSGYYLLWEVVWEYLLDSDGLSKSVQVVLDLLYDLRNGGDFCPAFETHFGVSVATLEAEIFDRLTSYLSLRQAVQKAASESAGERHPGRMESEWHPQIFRDRSQATGWNAGAAVACWSSSDCPSWRSGCSCCSRPCR